MQPRRRQNKALAQQVHSPFNAKKGSWKKPLAITLGVAVILGLAGTAILLGWIKIPGFTPPGQMQTEPQEYPPDTVIHLMAGGDLNVTDSSVAAGQTEAGYDYKNVFLDVAPLLSGSDMTVLNFEGTVCGEPYGSQYASAPQQMVQALADIGVDFLQTANSCSITGGPLGMQSTINAVRSAGMEPLGTYPSKEEFEKNGGYVLRQVHGIKVALVAFTKGLGGRGLPQVSEGCVNLLYEDFASNYKTVDEAGITTVLRSAAAQKPDITIALLHWGSEFNDKISKTQEQIVQLMQSEGVDAIIGTHAHKVQQITFDEASGQVVAYCLGDFFGDGTKSDTAYSVLLDLEITKSGRTGETKITRADHVPIYIAREATGTRVLRIAEAIAAYESNNLGRVSAETYANMKSALTAIESRVKGK